MSIMCLHSWWDTFSSGSSEVVWGRYDDPYPIEAVVWFVSYLSMDTVLIFVHGLVTFESLMHHLIFGLAFFFMPDKSPSFLVASLVAQEFSTPFLNVFLFLRGFTGRDSTATTVIFLLFFVSFFATRVFLFGYTTTVYLVEVFRLQVLELPSPLAETIPLRGQLIYVLIFPMALGLQMFWGSRIVQKIVDAVCPKPTQVLPGGVVMQ